MEKVIVCLFSLFAVGLCAGLAGGWSDINIEDEALKEVLGSVEKKMNERSNSMFYETMLKVTKAEGQVVSGMKYKLTYTSGRTNCNKNKPNLVLEACEVKDERECQVTVWSQPWLKSVKILDFKCGDYGVKPKSHAKRCATIGKDRESFDAFKMQHNKLYESSKEEKRRFSIFQENMAIAQKIQDSEQGTACYGATQFADLSPEEFKQHLGLNPKLDAGHSMKQAAIPKDAPTSYDWRDHGAVTPVKNQGSCGSCWAFSTTGNIEGQWFLKKKNLVSLSEQELVSCDKVDHGCEGGLPSNAYKEIERLGGLEGEKDYAYTGEDDKCKFAKTKVKVYINSSVSISKDEGEMASWLAQNGPISIGINANVMQFYFGGISHPWKIFCNPSNLDHGVLIVGYGVEGSKPYWIIKNSWGPSWGEKGYYRAYRGDGVCGLNQMCTSSVVN